jgi:molecular chaperone HtpG
MEFVVRVGASSKRDLSPEELDRFIGEFGIGLLSGFMVADELLVLTRSIEPGSPALEWRARSDGTYTIRGIDVELAVGTRVILQLREEAAEYALLPRLAGLAHRYGRYLEHAVTVERIGDDSFVECASQNRGLWSITGEINEEMAEDLRWELGFLPLDVIHIADAELGLEAAAFVLPEPMPDKLVGAHWLYFKRMFVTDADVKVVPRWASFVRCVINSTKLRPTASRETVCEDEIFHATQQLIASRISSYLHDLAERRPDLLSRIISIHDESLRQLARQDEGFFRVVIDLLPFETSGGTLRFGDYRAENTVIRLAPTVDQFRACSGIAAAQGITVFNGGYAQHAELLERAVAIDPTLSLEVIDVRTLVEGLSRFDSDHVSSFRRLLDAAEQALEPFHCRPVVKAFEPDDVPAVFAEGAEQSLARSIGSAHAKSEGFWKEVLSALDAQIAESERGSFLCFNGRCALVQSLGEVADSRLLQEIVRVLYVQALLLGHQPLTEQEMRAFVEALTRLITEAPRRSEP